MKLFNKSSRKGFTLIELLIVIAIMGVLSASVLVAVDPADKINAANDARAINDISAMGRAAEAYAVLQSASYPLTMGELQTLGELKRIPAPPTTSYTYTYTPTPSTCTTAGKTCLNIAISSNLTSKKYTSTPKWLYDSTTGKSCAVAAATTTCP
jgi:prepilin-type N-terminal cleavage/methylation domain-containing protein